MKLMKIIRIFGFITLLSLIYINMQMKIYDLAYQGKNKEAKVRELHELNGNETYTILKLKSANNIGYHLLAENSDLKFRDDNQVVRIQTAQAENSESRVALSDWKERTSSLLNLISFGSQAEARPQNK